MRIYAAYFMIFAAYLGKMPHILPHFWLASFPHIFQKKSCYKPVSLVTVCSIELCSVSYSEIEQVTTVKTSASVRMQYSRGSEV